MSDEKTIGEQNYEQFARRYAEKARTKMHNAQYERPATLSLLPDVDRLRVLDAGCGPGIYAEWLLDRGAQVTAMDVTPEFVQITRERVGDRAKVLRADLNQPLSFAGDGAFDLVVCPLVLDYIHDWRAVFREFNRVLTAGGVLVYSASHPTWDCYHVNSGGQYFEIEMREMVWGGFGEPKPTVKAYRRPLSEFINPLMETGFRLDRLLEPRPTEVFRQHEPEEYAQLMREPGFLCVRAVKD